MMSIRQLQHGPLQIEMLNDLLSLAVRVNSLLANNVLGVQAGIGLRNELIYRALWTDRRMLIRHLNCKNCFGKVQVPCIHFTHTIAKHCYGCRPGEFSDLQRWVKGSARHKYTGYFRSWPKSGLQS